LPRHGGTLSALGQRPADFIARPQVGWGLFSVGLIPIGVAAITRRLSLPVRLMLPVGGLFLLGEPLKYSLGERTGGVTVLVAFGVGWLAIGALLLFEAEPRARRDQSSTGAL